MSEDESYGLYPYQDRYYDHLFKIILIGESGVGKTCMMLRFAENSFRSSFTHTLGVDFKIKTIELRGKRIKLQIWDTAGQERYNAITTAHYKHAHGIIIVYDITDYNSFRKIHKWIKNVDDCGKEGIHRMLIGNKCDMNEERVVAYEKGRVFAEDHEMIFQETSAKTNHNIDRIFFELAERILFKNPEDILPVKRLSLTQRTIESSKKSCKYFARCGGY